MTKCDLCDKKAIGSMVDPFTLKDNTFYCDNHFDDVCFTKIKMEDLKE